MNCPRCGSEFLTTGALPNLVGRKTCPECSTVLHIGDDELAQDAELRVKMGSGTGKMQLPPLAALGPPPAQGGSGAKPVAPWTPGAPPPVPRTAGAPSIERLTAADLAFSGMNLELESAPGEQKLRLKTSGTGPHRVQASAAPPPAPVAAPPPPATGSGPVAKGSAPVARGSAPVPVGSGTGPHAIVRLGATTGKHAVAVVAAPTPVPAAPGAASAAPPAPAAPAAPAADEPPAPPPRRAANVTLARTAGPGLVLGLLGQRRVQIGVTVVLGGLVAAVLLHALFSGSGASGAGDGGAAGAALFTAPLQAKVAYDRAVAAAARGEGEIAAAAYEEAFHCDPSLADAIREAGLLRARDGDTDIAVRHLKKYIEVRPDAPDRPAVEKAIARLED